jgi:hypothetical protein
MGRLGGGLAAYGGLLGWCVLLAIGVVGIADWVGSSVVVGVLFALLGAFGLLATLRRRVWVHGNVLYSRRFLDYQPAIRLDRLTDAYLTHFGPDNGRQLRFADADGTRIELDVTNMQVARLYPVLAEHIRHDGAVANDLLQRRMARYRPDFPLGLQRP